MVGWWLVGDTNSKILEIVPATQPTSVWRTQGFFHTDHLEMGQNGGFVWSFLEHQCFDKWFDNGGITLKALMGMKILGSIEGTFVPFPTHFGDRWEITRFHPQLWGRLELGPAVVVVFGSSPVHQIHERSTAERTNAWFFPTFAQYFWADTVAKQKLTSKILNPSAQTCSSWSLYWSSWLGN